MKTFCLMLLLAICLFTFAQEPRLMLPIGHSGNITYIQFSPNDTKVVTASSDNTAKVWDAINGRLLVELKGHVGKVNTAMFNAEGTKIVTSSDDSSLIVWDVLTGTIEREFEGNSNKAVWAEFSPDGSKIASASLNETIKVWNVKTGEIVRTIRLEGAQFQSVQFCKNGQQLLSTSYTGPPTLWNAETGILISSLNWKYDNGVVLACTNRDASIIYTAGYDHIGTAWNAETGTLQKEMYVGRDEPSSMQLSPDGQYLLITSWYKKPGIWNIETGKSEIQVNAEMNTSGAFSNDGKKIITGSLFGTAEIRDLSSGKILSHLKGFTKGAGIFEFSPDGSQFLITANIDAFSVWDANTFTQNFSMKIPSSPYNRFDFNPDGKTLLISSASDTSYFINSQTGARMRDLKGYSMSSGNVPVFSKDGKKILKLCHDSVARVWNTANGDLLFAVRDSLNPVINVEMSADGSKILTVHKDETVVIRNGNDGSSIAKLDDIINGLLYAQFCPKGLIVLTNIRNVASLWNANTGEKLTDFRGYKTDDLPAIFSPDGKKFIKRTNNRTALVFDTANSKPPLVLSSPTDNYYKIAFSSNGEEIITATYGNLVQVWNSENGKLKNEIGLGTNTNFTDFNHAEDKILATNNSELRLLSFGDKRDMISFYMIDSSDWSVVHASGLFDASPGAMEKMYWVKGTEIIELSQLKERYYQPGLYKMIITGKPLRSVEGMGVLKMQPEVQVEPPQNGILRINLVKRDGGYGRIAVFVNNKEVMEDARPKGFDTSLVKQSIEVNIAQWLIPSFENSILVKAETADGFLTGRGIAVKAGSAGNAGSFTSSKPAFYAIICGTASYSSPDIKLTYPVPDATAISQALRIGANNLFGTDSAHIYLLTSPGEKPTTKKNIEAAFKMVEKNAKPDDIVLVYLSGHGITWGGEKGDFFYLTSEASSSSSDGFKDPKIREKQTISTREFTVWLNAIPALKQVMIIDACGSGKAVENHITKRDIDPSQIRAIDRMKDRTGLYIISGCAADAESYESSIYGQGLLTYSLLEAMKGAALIENKYVDIDALLDHARENVPKYAMGLGGIQTPQLLKPKGGSFDIGIINETDKPQIPLAGVKLVFTRSSVQEEVKRRDVLKLSIALDEMLGNLASPADGPGEIVFIDKAEFPDGCNISGGYTVTGNLLNFTGSILCGTQEKQLKFEKITKEKLLLEVQKIVKEMAAAADKIRNPM